jgi:hypothetical protein
MKTIYTTFLITLSFSAMSQGNLQFNRVWNFSQGSSYNVPIGKVLKIESINFNDAKTSLSLQSCGLSYNGTGINCIYSVASPVFTINQNSFYPSSENGSIFYGGQNIGYYTNCSQCPPNRIVGFSSAGLSFSLPIWLGEGEIISINGSGIFISALEFNVTQ